MDSSRAVVPLDSVFPEGVTTEQRDERNATLMVDSQHEATAAALNELGYDTGAEVVVVDAVADSPADGTLEGRRRDHRDRRHGCRVGDGAAGRDPEGRGETR